MMCSYNYTYLTKKQAGIVFAAYKRGDIDVSQKFINAMYNIVGVRVGGMDEAMFDIYSRASHAIDAIFDDNYVAANGILRGEGWERCENIIGYKEVNGRFGKVNKPIVDSYKWEKRRDTMPYVTNKVNELI